MWLSFSDPVIFSMVRKPGMGLFRNLKQAPGETNQPTPHQATDMSDQQQRQQKIQEMDSMCTTVKNKQTYMNLTRRQWLDRFLELNPSTEIKDLAEGDFHIVELAQACLCPPEDEDDLESINSEDEETLHEYEGKMYTGRELLDKWEAEADQAKQDFKEYEKANNKPAKKRKVDKSDKSDNDKSDGAGAKGAKAKTGTVWSRFLNGNRTVLGPSLYKKFCVEVGRRRRRRQLKLHQLPSGTHHCPRRGTFPTWRTLGSISTALTTSCSRPRKAH